jgi:hypothetical protein
MGPSIRAGGIRREQRSAIPSIPERSTADEGEEARQGWGKKLKSHGREGFYNISRVVQGGVIRHNSLEWSAVPSLML